MIRLFRVTVTPPGLGKNPNNLENTVYFQSDGILVLDLKLSQQALVFLNS